MKKFFTVVLSLLMAMSMATVACAEGTIKIGGTGPLTGDAAIYGIAVKQGAQVAIDEINAAGGINGMQVEFKFQDDQCDGELAINGYSILMDWGMNASIGAVTSGACLALAEESSADGLLVITPSASMKDCVQWDNVFRVCFTDPDQGTYSADFIAENKIATKVAIIYDRSSDYSTGITGTFEAEAAAKGLTVVTKQAFTNQSNIDFSVQLKAVAESGAELLFMPMYYTEAAYILTQADAMGLDIIYFGVDGMDGILNTLTGDNAKLCEGIMLLTPFAADAQDDQTVAFVEAYTKAFNEIPNQFAADAYDAVYAIKAAVEKADVTTDMDVDAFNAAVVGAMTSISVDGLTGSMTWTAEGEANKGATAVVITDGAYVAYGNK